jgi:hypothetical protein
MLHKLQSFSAAVALTALSITAQAQPELKTPAPSPSTTVKQAFALSEITLDYSRPSAKGRVVYGELVPYGKIWRTGANAATKIGFGEDVKIEGIAVPSGTYALYTIPNKDSWEIMLYKDLTLGGNVSDYKKENEVAHFTIQAKPLNDKVETFSIWFSDITSNTTAVTLDWEKTRVAFKVVADIDSKIMKNIEASVINDAKPYFRAASYYYDNDKDLAKALEWTEKAMVQNPKAYWVVLLKAKIQAKQKDIKGSTATAEKVIAMAKEAKDDHYVSLAEELIAQNKK